MATLIDILPGKTVGSKNLKVINPTVKRSVDTYLSWVSDAALKKFTELRKDHATFLNFYNLSVRTSGRRHLATTMDDLAKQINQRTKALVIELSLPSKALGLPNLCLDYNSATSDDATSADLLVMSPYSTLGEIKALMDQLNMVIIPQEMFKKQGYPDEWGSDVSARAKNRVLLKAISKFGNMAKDLKYDQYILCPADFLNIEALVKSDPSTTILYASSLAPVMSSINIQMPLFRSIYSQLANLQSGQESIKESVIGMGKELARVSAEIVEQKAKAVALEQKMEQQAKDHAAALARAEEAARAALAAMDPLLFAVPKGTDLRKQDGSQTIHLGPCWGSDISMDDLDLLQLTKLDQEEINNRTEYLNMLAGV